MHRIAVLVAAVTGLRRSEIRGLQWNGFDFDGLWLNLRRGIVRKHRTKLKTEASRKGVPIPQDLADVLLDWRIKSVYRAETDCVFASEKNSKKTPIWLDLVLQDYIQPAAKAAGINKRIGWHTLPRSLATLLSSEGENVKVVQELLRHSNSSITMDLYQQADQDAKRTAQGHLSSLFLIQDKAS